ncbi:uncharacterized protein ACB058_015824 [Synchiropus picturatus]
MMSVFFSVLLAAACLGSRAQKDEVLQPEKEVTAAEGDTQTLSCQYKSMSSISGNEVGPSFFKLQRDNTTACLATGFSRHKAVSDSEQRELFEGTDAARITGSSMFSQLALLNDANQDKCEAGIVIEDPCDEVVETDEKMNLTTLTLLVLRLLFIKTLVFNVLMSLRFWTRE